MRALLVACMVWLALPAAAQDLKLVPQTVGVGAFDAAGWTPDGRWLVTASGYEQLLRIWDPESGIIVDSVRLPLPGKRADEKLVLDAVIVSPDGRRATVEAVLVAENSAIGDTHYAAHAISVDLVSRQATIVPATFDHEDPSRRVPAQGEVADVDAGKPRLPAAPDGRRLQRTPERTLRILSPSGEELGTLSGEKPMFTEWVSMSPDGTLAVFVSPGSADELLAAVAEAENEAAAADTWVTRFVLFDIAKGSYEDPELVPGQFSRVGWLTGRTIVVSEASSPRDRSKFHAPSKKGPPTDGRIIDLRDDGAEPLTVPARCYLQPLGKTRLVGAGLANCRHGVPDERNVWVADVGGEWRKLPVNLPPGVTIDALRASPDGKTIALSLGRKNNALELRLVDSITGEEITGLEAEGPMVTAFDFLPDGRSMVVMANRLAVLWHFDDRPVETLPATDQDPSMMASDGSILLFGGETSPLVQRVNLATRSAMPSLDGQAPVSGGYLPAQKLFWVGTANGELKLLDGRDQTLVLTLQRFLNESEEYFLVHDPLGRYDSNLQPDYAPFQWLVMDAPFQSLSPQTFMRELYTPDLMGRLMACWPTRSCDKALSVALDVGAMNRTLPEVTSIEVSPGSLPGRVDVTVTVEEGVNELPSAAYYRARSGMHNLRLFRDGVLVAEVGAPDASLDPADRAGWRAATKLSPNRPDGTHVAVFRNIALPSGPPKEPMTFSAYAFNEDRVRGEEVQQEIELPALIKLAGALATPRTRRLFLVSIGVDAYPGGLFRPLRYAVADARAMSGLFGKAFINPREDRRMEVVEIRVEGTAKRPATRAMIAEAFQRLTAATPDDMVVVSFSGHGYTDAKGRFSLVPSDVRTKGDQPVRESMIGAEDLAAWLMPVDAGDIHLVIDACHSAASVQSGGFKPGPMGDPGLGQLAYDKGIRILSASAPDQYAMEDTALGHGLLTYALVEEGARQGKADADEDKVVTFDELMAYAVHRLPEMGDPTDPMDGPGLVVEWDGPPTPKQTPKLFDFAIDWSPLAVRDLGASVQAKPGAAAAGGGR